MNGPLTISVGWGALAATVGAVGCTLLAGVIGLGPVSTALMSALGGVVGSVAVIAAAVRAQSPAEVRVRPEVVPLEDDTVPSVSPLLVQLELLAEARPAASVELRGVPRNLHDALGQVADRIAADEGRVQGLELRVRGLQSDFERIERRATTAESVRDAFLARMSHELRTPLNAILGYLEMVEEGVVDPDLREDLARVRSSAMQLRAAVTTVLDLTQLETNAFDVVPEAVDLPELLQDVRESVAAEAAANQNVLQTSIPDGLSVRLDRRMLKSILYNLASNACKYTSGGSVQVEVEEETGQIRLVVSDTGIGMTPRQMREAFRPFVQSDSSSTRRYDGAGVGLAVVRGFAEAMGGRVAIESAPGHGSRVEVSLPRQCAPRTAMHGEDDPTMLVR